MRSRVALVALLACGLAFTAGAAACNDQPTSPPETDDAPATGTMTEADLEGQINELIEDIFPPGEMKRRANQAFAEIKGAIARGDTQRARERMYEFVDFLLAKARAGVLEDAAGAESTSAREGAAELTRLYYRFVGLEAPPITAEALSESGGADIVQPDEATTVEAGDGDAAVDVPSGTFSEPTLISMERKENPPEPGKGPLPLTLEGTQYGPFYDIEASTQPDGSLAVGTCVPTSGSLAPPSDEQDDLRIAKSTDEPGKPAFLPSASTGFLSCDAGEMPLAGETTAFSTFGAGNQMGAEVVATGKGYTCALREDGQAFCWGVHENPDTGARVYLGNDTVNASISTTPMPVMQGGVAYDTLVAGEDHACGLTGGGIAYCWGENWGGQLGDGSTNNSTTPVRVVGQTFDRISAGTWHNCGVSGTDAYCWGIDGFLSGLFTNLTSFVESSPIPVATGQSWKVVDAGFLTNCGITTSNEAYCWGIDWWGSHGDGTVNPHGQREPVPQLVAGGHTFDRITTGDITGCGITSGNVAYCWGINGSGQLGVGVQPDLSTIGEENAYFKVNEPAPRPVAGGHEFTMVVTNHHNKFESHTCGIEAGSHRAYCWGSNKSGQVGVASGSSPETCISGTTTAPCSIDPHLVTSTLQFKDLALVTGLHRDAPSPTDEISATCGATTSGEVYCWGNNDHGQLGDGSTTASSTPVKVSN